MPLAAQRVMSTGARQSKNDIKVQMPPRVTGYYVRAHTAEESLEGHAPNASADTSGGEATRMFIVFSLLICFF